MLTLGIHQFVYNKHNNLSINKGNQTNWKWDSVSCRPTIISIIKCVPNMHSETSDWRYVVEAINEINIPETASWLYTAETADSQYVVETID